MFFKLRKWNYDVIMFYLILIYVFYYIEWKFIILWKILIFGDG